MTTANATASHLSNDLFHYGEEYHPTEADLQDWMRHCDKLAAEDAITRSEIGRLLHIEEGDTYRVNDQGQPVDDWGDVIEPDCDDMDGDHESALESVYGPVDYEEDQNGNLWAVYSNGLGVRV